MQKVSLSDSVFYKIRELKDYLLNVLKLSETGADVRINRIEKFLKSFDGIVNYPLCRYKRWRNLGYHCVTFESWVFAYEILEDGIIIQDMKHSATLITTE